MGPCVLPGRFFLECRGEVHFVLQHSVQPLDGSDDDFRGAGDGVSGQTLDAVLFGEVQVVIRAGEKLEFVFGLLAQVVAVDEEKDTTGSGEFDQAVDEGDGGKGLAATHGHLDERSRAVVGKRFL